MAQNLLLKNRNPERLQAAARFTANTGPAILPKAVTKLEHFKKFCTH
jgi:hypothetical protein